jgi:hypothetical protein
MFVFWRVKDEKEERMVGEVVWSGESTTHCELMPYQQKQVEDRHLFLRSE